MEAKTAHVKARSVAHVGPRCCLFFPIPLQPLPDLPVGQGRQATRLRGRIRRINSDTNATVKALNWLAGDRRRPAYGPSVIPEQARVQARVQE